MIYDMLLTLGPSWSFRLPGIRRDVSGDLVYMTESDWANGLPATMKKLS